ncbi:MAG: hypothetical protein LBS28_05095 [Streptococcaceae bacterium]|jgi:hypothetical protein|nr:hypothetical protein [Streptococcaceae bacterium]
MLKKYLNIFLFIILIFIYVIYINSLIKQFNVLEYFRKIPGFKDVFNERAVVILIDILQIVTVFVSNIFQSIVISLVVSIVTKIKLRLKCTLAIVLMGNIITTFLNAIIFSLTKITKIKQAAIIGSLPVSWIIISIILIVYLNKKEITVKKLFLTELSLIIIGILLFLVNLFTLRGLK